MSYISRNIFIKPEETFGDANNLCSLGYFANLDFLTVASLVYALGPFRLPLAPTAPWNQMKQWKRPTGWDSWVTFRICRSRCGQVRAVTPRTWFGADAGIWQSSLRLPCFPLCTCLTLPGCAAVPGSPLSPEMGLFLPPPCKEQTSSRRQNEAGWARSLTGQAGGPVAGKWGSQNQSCSNPFITSPRALENSHFSCVSGEPVPYLGTC